MNRVACVNIWLMQWSQVKSDLCVSFLSMHCQGWTRWLVSAFPLLVNKSNRLKVPVVTLCTAKFNIQIFYVLPTQCINVSYGSQTATVCLYMAFITEVECVYCAVGAISIHLIQSNHSLQRVKGGFLSLSQTSSMFVHTHRERYLAQPITS